MRAAHDHGQATQLRATGELDGDVLWSAILEPVDKEDQEPAPEGLEEVTPPEDENVQPEGVEEVPEVEVEPGPGEPY